MWEEGVHGEGYFEDLKRLRQECRQLVDDLRKPVVPTATDVKRRSVVDTESRTHALVTNNRPGHSANPAIILPTAQLSKIPSRSDQRSETVVTENDAADVPLARHSVDFACVHWYGTDYIFMLNQAACVKVLWDAWANKSPTLFGATILTEADIDRSDGRLDLVFRGNSAWGKLIVSPEKGRYRLAQPAG